MVAEIVQAAPWHIKPIADRMRSADKEELRVLGYAPELAMHLSLRNASAAWTGRIDGEPVCMFGVSPTMALTPDRGRPWMMGTESLDKHAVLFLRRCQAQVEEMHRLFSQLENWIALSNKVAINWLRWLGFTFHEARPVGDMEFIRFTREAGMSDIAKKDMFQAGVEVAEDILLSVPEEQQIHVEPEHRFAEGLYARTLTMPKDTVWASRVHLHENFAFILKGSCIVVSENGSELITAPYAMKTEKGTKRLLRIIEECTWVTVHAKPDELGEDIEQIEGYLAVDTLEEYNLLVEEQKKLEGKP